MGLGILNPPGHPDSDPVLRIPGTHVLWTSEAVPHDASHIVLVPTVYFPPFNSAIDSLTADKRSKRSIELASMEEGCSTRYSLHRFCNCCLVISLSN